jgi:RNA polymerase sigma factor FliA
MLANATTSRNDLLKQHFGLVHHMARKMAKRLSTEASLDDLVSAGSVGLMSAAEHFDPSRGLAFSTFALPRIRGAMLDDLRKLDRVPRSVRRKGRTLQHTRELLCQRTGHVAADTEVALELGVPVETVWTWDAEIASAHVVALDPLLGASDERSAPQFAAEDEGADDRLERQAARGIIRDAVASLPPRERHVLALYYEEELTQSQIAQVLGVTESRVSQIRANAVARLRAQLEHRRDELALN